MEWSSYPLYVQACVIVVVAAGCVMLAAFSLYFVVTIARITKLLTLKELPAEAKKAAPYARVASEPGRRCAACSAALLEEPTRVVVDDKQSTAIRLCPACEAENYETLS